MSDQTRDGGPDAADADVEATDVEATDAEATEATDAEANDTDVEVTDTGAAPTEATDGGAEPSDAVSTSKAAGRTTTGTGRRPTPAASAASRARRIGGAAGTLKPAAAPPEADDEPDASDAAERRTRRRTAKAEPAAATAGEKVSTRKTGRTTSARDLKTEAQRERPVVTEVPGWLRWLPAIVLSVCALAMIVIIAVAAHGVWYAKPSTSTTRDKVLAAAKKCTALANTYNYKTLAADEKRGLACTTGAWTAQYRSALQKIVKPTATQLKASQTVQINAAGIESATGNGTQWTTIVYGQLTINQSGATPRIDPFAAVVRMDKVKSSYLVSKIDLITNSST
ncbi:hypothetical protein [uncultured Jatrophihabitans sp.]|uniref:hypothetical protein n=1 Tax=uncultured Jatrophihabitans sp. TaxID=1610747 RepID=UPI0035CC9EE6